MFANLCRNLSRVSFQQAQALGPGLLVHPQMSNNWAESATYVLPIPLRPECALKQGTKGD